ncbi:MAG: SAV_2336 N-terminal domain-related protein [Thermosynechococcaceae cyanobacterium]
MIDHWIATLRSDLGLSAEEIANFIWLATIQLQALSQSVTSVVDNDRTDIQLGTEDNSNGMQSKRSRGSNSENQQGNSDLNSDHQQTHKKKENSKSQGRLFPNKLASDLHSVGTKANSPLIKVKNPPSIRNGLELARSLRPLIRVVPSGRDVRLDENETVRKVAEARIWLPVTKPVLEPWLDLALVVDESSSMLIWRQTVLDFQRLLKQYGSFRDVRTWGLVATEEASSQDFQQYKVYLRSGFGIAAKQQDLQDPKALIDPNRRRLVLVVTDCLSTIWRRGFVFPALNTWAENGPMAIVQMLPEWLWVRTALRHTSPVQFYGLEQGIANQQLSVVGSSTFDQEEDGVVNTIRVPVLTLEPHRTGVWSQMVAGKGGVQASGVIFSPHLQSVVDQNELRRRQIQQPATDLSPQKRVDDFRLTATPMARRLASLVAAAPVINLPVVRLIQETLLEDSQQVHVAEVLLGGLLTPTEQATLATKPDDVVYRFVDEGIRPILLKTASVIDTTEVFSKYVIRQFGTSLEVFLLKLQVWMTSEDQVIVDEVRPLAIVASEVLKRWGRHYADIVEAVEKRYELKIREKVDLQHQNLFPDDRGETLKRNVAEAYQPRQLLQRPDANAKIIQIDKLENRIQCIYTGYSIVLDETNRLADKGFEHGINFDTICPHSKRSGEFSGDMHHIFPAKAKVNSARGALPFAELADAEVLEWFRNDDQMTTIPSDYKGEYSRKGRQGFEPRDQAKGRVARALFYVYTIYEGQADPSFFEKQKVVLRQWHSNYPPTQEELIRSQKIAKSEQGNANPFVVDPTLVERIFFAEMEWQTFEFKIATILLLSTVEVEVARIEQLLMPFEFQIATLVLERTKKQPSYKINHTASSAYQWVENLGNNITLEMVSIPAGRFEMGAPKTEADSEDYERPQHPVEIRQPFWMGKYPVTQAQWQAVAKLPQVSRNLKANPSQFKGADRPVERVSWLDAVEFCQRLSIHAGRDYRLPSEAEWEYACRAGTTTPFHFGETITTEVANYDGTRTYANGPKGTYRKETTSVGSFSVANAFGLYDMHGNVWEWCEDDWHGNYEGAPADGRPWVETNREGTLRLLRGGSWDNDPWYCRSARRDNDVAGDESDYDVGFRVVCSAARTS